MLYSCLHWPEQIVVFCELRALSRTKVTTCFSCTPHGCTWERLSCCSGKPIRHHGYTVWMSSGKNSYSQISRQHWYTGMDLAQLFLVYQLCLYLCYSDLASRDPCPGVITIILLQHTVHGAALEGTGQSEADIEHDNSCGFENLSDFCYGDHIACWLVSGCNSMFNV